jgi:hypothetical protein
MVRISASILSFLFEAKARKLSNNVMVENINKALREKKDRYNILKTENLSTQRASQHHR